MQKWKKTIKMRIFESQLASMDLKKSLHHFLWPLLVGLVAGLLSGSVGFGGGMVLLPVITYFYGVEVAVPVSTIAQLVSNLSRVGMGWKQINWKAAGQFLLLAVPFTALGALGFAKFPKGPMTIVLCVFLIVFAILKLRGKMTLAVPYSFLWTSPR